MPTMLLGSGVWQVGEDEDEGERIHGIPATGGQTHPYNRYGIGPRGNN